MSPILIQLLCSRPQFPFPFLQSLDFHQLLSRLLVSTFVTGGQLFPFPLWYALLTFFCVRVVSPHPQGCSLSHTHQSYASCASDSIVFSWRTFPVCLWGCSLRQSPRRSWWRDQFPALLTRSISSSSWAIAFLIPGASQSPSIIPQQSSNLHLERSGRSRLSPHSQQAGHHGWLLDPSRTGEGGQETRWGTAAGSQSRSTGSCWSKEKLPRGTLDRLLSLQLAYQRYSSLCRTITQSHLHWPRLIPSRARSPKESHLGYNSWTLLWTCGRRWFHRLSVCSPWHVCSSRIQKFSRSLCKRGL